MANTTNSKISNLVSTQVPFFVRNDHETFVRFVEAYYEYLEQNGKTVQRAKTMPEHRDVDSTIDEFAEHFHENFLKLLPRDKIADQGYIIKHIKDFYRARGTEKAIRFLLRLLYGKEAEFYYPQRDVLIASGGNWFIEKSIKVSDIKVNGVSNTYIGILDKFISRRIVGQTSGAFALVEKADNYYDGGTQVLELKLSGQYKDFISGESIAATFFENGNELAITANLYSGILNDVTIAEGGTRYEIGDMVNIISNSGSGGIITVSSVSKGNILSIAVDEGGAGFIVNNQILISGTTGSGASANVSVVLKDGSVHPNTYNIGWQTIGMYANVTLNASNFFGTSANANINTTLANALSTFVYGNTGPIVATFLYSSGENYTTRPTISVQANSRIRTLGILGKMEIVSGGTGYLIGDVIEFINVLGGFGTGANAIVSNVAIGSGNAITGVQFVSNGSEIAGGVGYDMNYLPIANVRSSNAQAHGANVQVVCLLGRGETLTPITSTIGKIESLTIVSRGTGYLTAPTLDLSGSGDGTAQASVDIITGTYTYPGRYINDDGHLSGYNFLQDEHYYQPFSYVVKAKESIESYRKILKDILHPAGMKLFGEYAFVGETPIAAGMQSASIVAANSTYLGNYVASGNAMGTTIQVSTIRDTTDMTNVYIEYATGNTSYLANGIYLASIVNTTTFIVRQASNTVNGSGTVYFTRT